MSLPPRCFTALAFGCALACLPGHSADLPARLQTGPLKAVIEQLYGQPVRSHAGESGDALRAALSAAIESINRDGIAARRVNEVGNAVEPFVLAALDAQGFATGIPTTASGRRQSSGYPDLVARRGEDVFYIEVKTYNLRNEHTTQRSFYLSPTADPKVTEPAFHLLMAFAMEQGEDGRYRALSGRLLDIAELPLDLKLEFNASNRDLYDAGLELFTAPASEPAFPDPVRRDNEASTIPLYSAPVTQ